jgi:hypothetical protein
MRVNATARNRICHPHPDGLRESVIFVQCCPSYELDRWIRDCIFFRTLFLDTFLSVLLSYMAPLSSKNKLMASDCAIIHVPAFISDIIRVIRRLCRSMLVEEGK